MDRVELLNLMRRYYGVPPFDASTSPFLFSEEFRAYVEKICDMSMEEIYRTIHFNKVLFATHGGTFAFGISPQVIRPGGRVAFVPQQHIQTVLRAKVYGHAKPGCLRGFKDRHLCAMSYDEDIQAILDRGYPVYMGNKPCKAVYAVMVPCRNVAVLHELRAYCKMRDPS